ncbi:hypothetical protein GCM10010441_25340 [Kitasatospora paracochleata]|uniref:Uncharacterized protein n=1 Tax=Kitasatospora paracochleata TaxID=58354 RepID=A0ABT1J0Z6_9ACTN|nr:hypothetical protein [Kitasatospora paracochleata]MCP2311091.1 hypothetical protein [Kitasatospora paracochleata]
MEIEGPDGLIGGAHGLPVALDDSIERTDDGRIRISPETAGSASLTLPVQALCPGFDGMAVQRSLQAPTDSSNTITGQPRYTLTVSISDPAIGALRHAVGSNTTGDVLSADNRIPR